MTARSGARLRAITLVSSLALLAAPAFAQSPQPGGGAPVMGSPGPAGGAMAQKPKAPTPNPLTQEDVSQIKGAAVYGSDDKKIGDVATVLMKPETKTIDRLVVGEGGVLGIGAHDVALPVSDFSWDSQAGNFKITHTADELKSMPEWHEQLSEAPGGASESAPIPQGAPSSPPPAGGGKM